MNSDALNSELLSFRLAAQVAVITLNRPAARNSLSLELIQALTHQFETLSAHSDVHVIVLAANGPAFCAGHDLKELNAARNTADQGEAFFTQTMSECATLMQSIVRCSKPVIAAVQGVATAAGCQLVASCDLAIASNQARFATPGVNIGLFCSTPMVALSRNVARKQAMQMLLTGELISAEQACQWGLVNEVAAPEETLSRAMELANTIAAKPPKTVALGKQAFYQQLEDPLSQAYDYTAAVMVKNMLMPDAKEGIAAFIGKRKPQWESLQDED